MNLTYLNSVRVLFFSSADARCFTPSSPSLFHLRLYSKYNIILVGQFKLIIPVKVLYMYILCSTNLLIAVVESGWKFFWPLLQQEGYKMPCNYMATFYSFS